MFVRGGPQTITKILERAGNRPPGGEDAHLRQTHSECYFVFSTKHVFYGKVKNKKQKNTEKTHGSS